VPQLTRKKQSFSSLCKDLEMCLRRDPSRPAYTAVRAAFIRRFAHYFLLLTEPGSEGARSKDSFTEEAVAELVSETKRLDSECSQLAGLLSLGSGYQGDWRDPQIVKFLRRTLRRSGRGHPLTARRVALRALDLRLGDTVRWSWRELANQLCLSDSCRRNLRRNVLWLQRSLRDLRVKLPSPRK